MDYGANELERLNEAKASIDAAIQSGVWIDPGPAELRRLLGHGVEGLPKLELFTTQAMMSVITRTAERNFLEYPQFCLVRTRNELGPNDPRLALSGAWVIVGSVVPGDDVLAAVDVNAGDEEIRIRIFDWNRRVPNRWVDVSSLESFIAELAKCVGTKTTND